MTEEGRVSELIARWQDHRKQGRDVSAEELCRETPDLLEPLKRRLERLVTPTESATPVADAASSLLEPAPATLSPVLPDVAGHLLLQRLGRGGIGVVYKARDLRLDRDVALKMLRAGALAEEPLLERFLREARAMARLKHPHIVDIFSEGTCHGQPYFTMRLMEGGTLAEHLPRYRADPRQAVELMVKVTRAVHYLHANEILHRDLKPLNILLDSNDEPCVSDFGLAKFLDEDLELTQTGEVMGTLPYMAPEQAAGRLRQLGPATDVWALGVILFEMIYGQRPFRGENREELLRHILKDDPTIPRAGRSTPCRVLEPVVLKCLEKDPGRRFSSAGALADELQRWLDRQQVLTRSPSPLQRLRRTAGKHLFLVGSVVLLALVMASLAFFLSQTDPGQPMRTLQRELAEGRPVELLDEAGQLSSFRWRAGGAPLVSSAQGRSFTFNSYNVSLLELLPDPARDSYRLRAQIRHDQGTAASEVGLYMALVGYETPRGQIQAFLAWVFNDVEPLKEGFENKAALTLRLYRSSDSEGKAKGVHQKQGGGKPFSFMPALQPPGSGPWRRLAVTVTPEAIRTFWEGAPVNQLRRAELLQRARLLLADCPELAGVTYEFRPRGGFGLLLNEGAASFKDIRVEPLDPGM